MRSERNVKKKIRAIQYGVGPIGASIVKLLREKQAVEIVGAIDIDPAKAGRDLGEVAGAADAAWGGKISANAKEGLEESGEGGIHSSASAVPRGRDGLL